MRDFKTLTVWQKSHQWVLRIYQMTADLPSQERYGLIDQIRRAAVSIPSNIAEGSGRDSDKDFRRFLSIAMGSASELEYQLILLRDLGYLDQPTYDDLNAELLVIKRMLNSFMQKLSAS